LDLLGPSVYKASDIFVKIKSGNNNMQSGVSIRKISEDVNIDFKDTPNLMRQIGSKIGKKKINI